MHKRNDTLYLHDIFDSSNAILDYVKNMSYKDFSTDRKTYSAVIREFKIIG